MEAQRQNDDPQRIIYRPIHLTSLSTTRLTPRLPTHVSNWCLTIQLRHDLHRVQQAAPFLSLGSLLRSRLILK